MVQNLALIFVGGGLGAILRYLASHLVYHLAPGFSFPLETFLVNVLGSFLIGVLTPIVTESANFSPSLSLFLLTGLLGGFTTFSTFSYQSLALVKADLTLLSMLYIGLSVLIGILSCYFGLFVSRYF